MKVICWSAAALAVVVLVFSSCGSVPLYACPDQSHPCDQPDLDAGADADADQ